MPARCAPWVIAGSFLNVTEDAAVILDAGAPDSAELNEMGFAVWSRAISAAGTNKANPGWVNVPVSIGDVTNRPGDLGVADDDGVCVVKAEYARAVVAACESRTTKEDASRKRYQAGAVSLDVSSLRPWLEQLGVRTFDSLAQATAAG